MNSNLDIYAIQYYPNELYNALNKIDNGINIIYSNVKSNLSIGNIKVTSRKFDTVLYNEESDILIMLMRDGFVNKEDIINYLENNKKRYVEIDFNYKIYDYVEQDNVPELWFAREKYVLEEAFKDSIDKGINYCEYYPVIKSELKLGFLTKTYNYTNLDTMNFRGVIKLKDKIILIVNQKNNIDKKGISRNMGVFDIINIADDLNIKCNTIFDKHPKIFENNFSKKLSLRKKDI